MQIQVTGYTITQLTETEYEAENKGQSLDFYFDTGHPNAVEVFIFDSKISTQGEGDQDPYITSFYAANLEDAVSKAMGLTRRELEGSRSPPHQMLIQKLYYFRDSMKTLKETASNLSGKPQVQFSPPGLNLTKVSMFRKKQWQRFYTTLPIWWSRKTAGRAVFILLLINTLGRRG
jgi:hypothetical protein